MPMADFKGRIKKLERMAVAATPCPPSEPFFSADHGCMMESRGGFVLPVVLAPDAWEAAAREHQAKLTGQA